MILEALELNNFRQFYGKQRIVFAGDKEQNVTVVHGFNGAGKTALLNAFVWCLYGDTTPDLDAKNKLVNESAMAEAGKDGTADFEVVLHYRLGSGAKYLARRSATAHSSNGEHRESKPELLLWVTGEDGEQRPVSGAQTHIDSQLPKDLVPFFFFNGERVERLANPDAYEKVEGGIKTLLNVQVFENGVKHLRTHVIKTLEKELRDHGSDELRDQLAEKEAQEVERDQLYEMNGQHLRNIAGCEAEIEAIETKQQAIESLSRLIEQKKAAKERVKGIKERLKTCESDLAESLSKDGFLAFGSDAISTTKTLVRDAHTRGQLPAKVKPQFVDDLLAQHMCICGRAIEPGSPEDTELQKWRSTTGLAALEEAILITSGATDSLAHRREEYFSRMETLRERQGDLKREKRNVEDELEQIVQDIGDRSTDEETAALRASKLRAEKTLREEILASRSCETSLKQIEQHISSLEKTIENLKVQGEKGKRISRQLTACRNVAAALHKIGELQKQDVRRSLDRQISEIWKDAAVKDYTASVSSKFRLELFKRTRGVTTRVQGASTGEKQVLALAFVGALVKKARENSERHAGGLITGGSYPLVMDSPFGSLEHAYQQKIAKWIPSLAGQVVVMASKSQWTPQVEQAMRPRVGAEYVLELHTPKDGAGQEIELNSRTYPYVKSTADDFELTIIQEVR